MFRLSGEDGRLGQNKVAVVISPFGEELFYYLKIKKWNLILTKEIKYNKRKTSIIFRVKKENKHKRIVKKNAGC